MVSDRFNLRTHSLVFKYLFYYFFKERCFIFIFYFLWRYNHGLWNCEVGVLAICLLSHSLEYIMVNIILIKSAACIQYNISLLPSVNTLIARGMFCGAKYTHHTFTPVIKHLTTTTANKKQTNKQNKIILVKRHFYLRFDLSVP